MAEHELELERPAWPPDRIAEAVSRMLPDHAVGIFDRLLMPSLANLAGRRDPPWISSYEARRAIAAIALLSCGMREENAWRFLGDMMNRKLGQTASLLLAFMHLGDAAANGNRDALKVYGNIREQLLPWREGDREL